MNKYIPLHCHSHYSLLDGLSKPEKMAKRIEDIEIDTCALTDHGNISGSVAFMNAMKKAKKKPILGCELYVSTGPATEKNKDNSKLTHLPVLAKNDAGWKQLVKLTSTSNFPEHFYHKPRLSLDELAVFADGNLMAFSGHLGSHIAKAIVTEDKIDPNWLNKSKFLAEWFRDTFGEDNFRLEVQLMDHINNPIQVQLTECVRELSQKTGIPIIATPDAHYAYKEDAIDQRILLCSNLRTTLTEAYQGKAGNLSTFFKSDNFHIPSYDEMIEYGHTEEELANTVEVASFVTPYENILRSPILPNFECPDGANPDDYLKQLCMETMKAKGKDTDEYKDRLKLETDVFSKANISSYFLIVYDILKFCHDKKWLVGPGRGSAAGCMVSYLTKITQIDPIIHDLWFERFYNDGRNTGGRVSMPDIDIDVPVHKREQVMNYIKDTYGLDKVSQMVTFQTIKGRGALKAVLRAHGGVPYEAMNLMTKDIPEEAKISGELATMKESRGESSILLWALENRPKKFSEWVTMNDDGSLEGPYARRFEQAIRLEGTKSSQSKHAAGIVIGREPLANVCPMVLDTKTKQMLGGLEMNDLEAIGMVKFDILGVAMLDKIMGVQEILETGDMNAA